MKVKSMPQRSPRTQREIRSRNPSVFSVSSVAKSLCFLAGFLSLSACMMGPKYEKPAINTPTAYKEIKDWKIAEPKDGVPRGQWWAVFGDPQLNALASKVEVNNQNLRFAEANYRRAQALVTQARGALFPSVSAALSTTRAGTGTRAPAAPS